MSNNIQRKKIAAGKTGDNNGVEIFQGFDDDNIYYKNRKGGLVQLPDLETVQGLVTAADELSEVLANGNTTGGTNIQVDTGDAILLGAAANLTGDGAGTVTLTTDRGLTVVDNLGASVLLKPATSEIVVSPSGIGAATLDFSAMTFGRNIVFQDVSGTVALLSDVPSQGIFGISDSSGVYTFYATIALANAAASSGDTIELFADHEETGAVEFIMKDGVTYNLNGHTYTLNVATTENTITDNNVAVTSTLMNGRFIRTGGTAGTGDSMTIHIDNASSNIICEGVIFESDFGLVVNADGGIEGATFKNTVYTGYMAYNVTGSGYFNNCSFESAAGGGVLLYGSLNDCIVIANGSVGVGSVGGTCNNCVIVSTANSGIAVQGTARIQSCVVTSSSSYGVQTQTDGPVRMSNTTVVSTANHALYGLHDIIVENCSLFSSTNNGAHTGGSTRLENCTINAIADAGVRLGGGFMVGCIVHCSWNNASGHAVECVTGSTVFNNLLEVANTSANNIKNEGVTPTVTYGQNTYKGGATTPVEATIVQGQTNTHDTYGNIDIG